MSDETTTDRADADTSSMEDLLAEYEQAKTPPPAAAPPPKTDDDVGLLRARLEALEAHQAGITVETKLGQAVKVIREEHPELKKLAAGAIRGAIREAAENDSRFRTAFFTAPDKEWRKIVAGVGKTLLPEPDEAPDDKTTSDRAAMQASLKSVSTKAPEREDESVKIWKMSPAEFRKHVQSISG